jgi:hypothetical protein
LQTGTILAVGPREGGSSPLPPLILWNPIEPSKNFLTEVLKTWQAGLSWSGRAGVGHHATKLGVLCQRMGGATVMLPLLPVRSSCCKLDFVGWRDLCLHYWHRWVPCQHWAARMLLLLAHTTIYMCQSLLRSFGHTHMQIKVKNKYKHLYT